MARMATMSVLGLYQYDNSLFNLFSFPDGIDRDVLFNTILDETAELEVVYPSPGVLKTLIGVWSAKQLPVWKKLYETMLFDYNPIENYDRIEEGTTDGARSQVHSGQDTSTGKDTYGGADTHTMERAHTGTDNMSGTDEKGHFVAGFDAPSGSEPDGLFKQSRDNDSMNSEAEYLRNENVTEETAYGQTINRDNVMTHGETVTDTEQGTHRLRAHGNIGVTTTQQMIEQEREIVQFNIIDKIVSDFKAKFCILVY